jgi:hypothetical protein
VSLNFNFEFRGRFGKEVCDAVVAKCLTGRPKTVEKAQAVFLLWVELEAVDAFLVLFFLVHLISIEWFSTIFSL